MFGGGAMSSSDGQRFPVGGKSLTGQEMTVLGGQVPSTYTRVSDQHSTFSAKVIVAATREAQYVLDDFLGNATICRSTSMQPTRTALLSDSPSPSSSGSSCCPG